MEIGTPEWSALTQLRARLIRKKVRGELTPAEAMELEAANELSLATINRTYPFEPDPRITAIIARYDTEHNDGE